MTASTVRKLLPVALTACFQPCIGQTVELQWWVPNGSVTSMVCDPANDQIIMTGQFTGFMAPVGQGGIVNAVTGEAPIIPAVPSNSVEVAVPDGSGGWYISGGFEHISGAVRNGLARINADGSLHAWAPAGTNGDIETMVVGHGRVYIGGDFTDVGGMPMNRLAALDTLIGAVVPTWGPGANDDVRSLCLQDTTLYIGGLFTTLAGSPRTRLASVHALTGALQAWSPVIDNDVWTIDIQGSSVYLAGYFSTVQGQTRRNLAKISTDPSATLQPWAPIQQSLVSDWIYHILCEGDRVYVAGDFSAMIGGAYRNSLCALDTILGNATSWAPIPDDPVNRIAIANGILYAGGDFTDVDGVPREGLAAWDVTTGLVTNWDPHPYFGTTWNGIRALSFSNGQVYIGGYFKGLNFTERKWIAMLDGVTGKPKIWQPTFAPNSPPRIGCVYNGVVYVMGSFDLVNGLPRGGLAAFDAATGALMNWAPEIGSNDNASCMTAGNGLVYIGGNFSSISGQTRHKLAAVDAVTGVVTPWNPVASGSSSSVHALELGTNSMYVYGNFTLINASLDRSGIAEVDLNIGTATTWAPVLDIGNGGEMAIDDSLVYFTGDFYTVNGVPRYGFAAVHRSTGQLSNLDMATDNPVHQVDIDQGILFMAGGYHTILGQPSHGESAFDIAQQSLINWDPMDVHYGSTIEACDGKLLLYQASTDEFVHDVYRPLFAVIDFGSYANTSGDGPILQDGFHLFPNPCGTDGVRLRYRGGTAGSVLGTFMLLDIQGREVLSQELLPAGPGVEVAVDFDGAVLPGTYLARLHVNDQRWVGKVVVQ